jgi:hypothetical protein
MTNEQWLTCNDPALMLDLLRDNRLFSRRKGRLFAVSVCRRVWDLLSTANQEAVETAEMFADGQASAEDLVAAYHAAGRRVVKAAQVSGVTSPDDPQFARRAGANPDAVMETFGCFAALHCSFSTPDWTRADAPAFLGGYADLTAISAAWVAATSATVVQQGEHAEWKAMFDGHERQERKAQCSLLHDLFSPFWATPSIEPSWHADTIKRLGEAAYEHRLLPSGHLEPDRLAVLCDALLDAGWPPDHELLAHLRGSALHVRGCVALDVLLERE